jgi:hypothetical protein
MRTIVRSASLARTTVRGAYDDEARGALREARARPGMCVAEGARNQGGCIVRIRRIRDCVPYVAQCACVVFPFIACSTNSTGGAPSDAGTGASVVDGGRRPDARAATDDDAAATEDAAPPTCPTPASVSGWTPPSYHRATGAKQGKCSPDLIDAYWNDCRDPSATKQSCAKWGAQADAAHKTCAQCIESGSASTKYGPLIFYSNVVTANLAGCIELEDPVNGLGCATLIQQKDACVHAACDTVCAVTDDASFQAWGQCDDAALAGACKAYVDKASACADAEQDAGTATACFGGDTGFRDYYDAIVPVFCGGAGDAADGGGDASEAGGG